MTLHLTFTAATAGKQQRQRRRQQQQLKTARQPSATRALFTSVALALSLSLCRHIARPPFWQAAQQRMLTTTREQQRQRQHQNSSNNFICIPARALPALPLSLCRCCAYAPTALRPLLLSGTFYESQRLFRTKLIIFTAYAVVGSCCCCSLLLLLLSVAAAAAATAVPLSFCMCCAFNQFNAKISPAIHFSCPAETCLFITLAFI